MRGMDGQDTGRGRGLVVGGVSLVYFVAALEILIMISPFAAFFYAAFNPLLLGLNRWEGTRWLTAFFLPHMVVPPTSTLVAIRVLGSGLFLGGSVLFLICAAQVYLGKLLRWRVATHGFYAVIRHPQYTGLILAGLGLTILWPRFLTLEFLALMVFLYWLLARDEEQRMLRAHSEGYLAYQQRTGMFWPRVRSRSVSTKPLTPPAAVLLLVGLLGGAAALGFGLRAYTVAHLPMVSAAGIDVLPIVPDDRALAAELVEAAVTDSSAAGYLRSMPAAGHGRVLAYVMPVDYVMQGMIANTGEEWKLFQRHQTFGMIADYVLHPIRHLKGGHMHHAGMAPMQHGPAMYASPMMRRRIVFLEIRGTRPLATRADDFAINNQRIPRFFADVHLHTDEVLQIQGTPSGTGWGSVPTPMF